MNKSNGSPSRVRVLVPPLRSLPVEFGTLESHHESTSSFLRVR